MAKVKLRIAASSDIHDVNHGAASVHFLVIDAYVQSAAFACHLALQIGDLRAIDRRRGVSVLVGQPIRVAFNVVEP
jgi:hypothetical protein